MAEYLDEKFHGSSSTAPRMPEPRLVKTARAAEEYAADVMSALGFSGVEVTPPGADGGVDVRAHDAVAQVKMEGVPTSRPVVQGLFGIAAHSRKLGCFFSLAGYTAGALEWAEEVGLACFEFEFDGELSPRTTVATNLMRYGYRSAQA